VRHAKFGRKLARDTKARKALLYNLASSLIVHGQITTTLAKAKFARVQVDKLVSAAKKNRLHHYRILASRLNRGAFLKLTNEIGPGFENRRGGYTRIIKIANRRGDASPMAKLEFVEWDKTKVKVSGVPKERKIRDLRGASKSKAEKSKITRNHKSNKRKDLIKSRKT
jgi:large subunit ribosomal protein L17